MRLFVLTAALIAAVACAPTETVTNANAAPEAASANYTLLNPSDYHSFVGNWMPDDHPLCAAFQSRADWDKVMHPAAVMGQNTFAPPGPIWNDHAVLLLAREVNAGDPSHVFAVSNVSMEQNALVVDYTFAPTPQSTSTQKVYFAVVVPKPLPQMIRFRQDGNVVCEVAPGGVSPAN